MSYLYKQHEFEKTAHHPSQLPEAPPLHRCLPGALGRPVQQCSKAESQDHATHPPDPRCLGPWLGLPHPGPPNGKTAYNIRPDLSPTNGAKDGN